MDGKLSSQLIDEAKLIIDGIRQNSITMPEAARSAAIGAVAAALVGGGLGAITGKKGKRGRRAIWGAGIGALSGAIAGPAYAQLRKYLDGIPFNNAWFDETPHNKGDKVYIGVAGSANGEGLGNSDFAYYMRQKFGGNVVMLRHVDDIAKKYKELKDKGLDVTVVGHSSGGASVAKFLRGNPDAKGYLIDPVSWTGRGVPDNAVVFTSDKSTRHGGPFDNTIADLGGRWNHVGKNSVVYRGSHSDKLWEIIRDYVSKGVWHEEKDNKAPKYVTSQFGKNLEPEKRGSANRWDRFSELRKIAQMGPGNVRFNVGNAQRAQKTLENIKDFLNESKWTLDDTAMRNPGKSDPYYHNILVGGANAGGKGFLGLSYLPFGVLANGPNRVLFRNGDEEGIRAEIERAVKAGLNPRVLGHSWGGSMVANIAKDYLDVPFVAIDPVGWTRVLRKTPKNLTIYYPRPGTESPRISFTTKWAPIVGHRWPRDIPGEGRIVEYNGDHVNGIDKAITELNDRVMCSRIAQKGENGKDAPKADVAKAGFKRTDPVGIL